MEHIHADLTAAFGDHTSGVGRGAAAVYAAGIIPRMRRVVRKSPGALPGERLDNATLCNASNKQVKVNNLPFEHCVAVMPTTDPAQKRVVGTAGPGGQITMPPDNRSWVDRMSALVQRVQTMTNPDEMFVAFIDLPHNGEVKDMRDYVATNALTVDRCFGDESPHVLLMNAACDDKHFMVRTDLGVQYATDKIRKQILGQMNPFCEFYYTTAAEAVECLLGSLQLGTGFAHCWLDLPFDHESVSTVMPYATASPGVDLDSISYSRTGGLSFRARPGNFYIAIVLSATSQIAESLACVQGNTSVDTMMQLIAARSEREVAYPYYMYAQQKSSIMANSDPFVAALSGIADQRKSELDKETGMVCYAHGKPNPAQFGIARHASMGTQ